MECYRFLHFLLGTHPTDLIGYPQPHRHSSVIKRKHKLHRARQSVYFHKWYIGNYFKPYAKRALSFNLQTIYFSNFDQEDNKTSLQLKLQDFERSVNIINQVLWSHIKSLVKIKECKKRCKDEGTLEPFFFLFSWRRKMREFTSTI